MMMVLVPCYVYTICKVIEQGVCMSVYLCVCFIGFLLVQTSLEDHSLFLASTPKHVEYV